MSEESRQLLADLSLFLNMNSFVDTLNGKMQKKCTLKAEEKDKQPGKGRFGTDKTLPASITECFIPWIIV